MMSDKIVYYDDEFLNKIDMLRELIDEGDHNRLRRFIIDGFGRIFVLFQYYARHFAERDDARDFENADEETKRELMRPLSYRQYRVVERAFSPYREDDDNVIGSIWDFLDDEGRIKQKKAMSVAEVDACSLIYERVLCRLS